MKSLYNRVFKNNQITYGRPYQIKVAEDLRHYSQANVQEVNDEEDFVNSSDPEIILKNAKRKAELLLQEAQLEADRLMQTSREQAQERAENIAEEAWQKGYAEGMEAAAQQNRSLLEEAELINRNAAEEYESQMNSMEADMVSLVIDVARKAVAGELATNNEVIMQLVRDALPGCSGKSDALIKVSPEDADYLEENIGELYSEVDGVDNLEIKRDSALKPGDCIIETSLGSVDAGAATRLDKIEEAFIEEMSGR